METQGYYNHILDDVQIEKQGANIIYEAWDKFPLPTKAEPNEKSRMISFDNNNFIEAAGFFIKAITTHVNNGLFIEKEKVLAKFETEEEALDYLETTRTLNKPFMQFA